MNYNINQNLYEKKECSSYNRCGLFRICEPCSRIRQSKICDITELAGRFSNHATYAVVMPVGKVKDTNIIKKLKTNLTRKMRKSTDGMMVSVETSVNDALHLNLIINSKDIITPRPFETVSKNLGIETNIFVETIQQNDIRKVSAYALKRQFIPSSDQYKGNTINMAGQVRTIKQIMQSRKMIQHQPLVAITSMSNKLIKLGLEPPTKSLLEIPRLKSSLTSLIHLVNQLDELDMCYSDKRGLLTADEFKKIYRKELGQWKRDIKKKNKKISFDNKWKKLHKGEYLKDQFRGQPLVLTGK